MALSRTVQVAARWGTMVPNCWAGSQRSSYGPMSVSMRISFARLAQPRRKTHPYGQVLHKVAQEDGLPLVFQGECRRFRVDIGIGCTFVCVQDKKRLDGGQRVILDDETIRRGQGGVVAERRGVLWISWVGGDGRTEAERSLTRRCSGCRLLCLFGQAA